VIADSEFRVWAIRQCADMIRGMETVREAVEHLESIADRLDLEYLVDVTEGVRDELGRPLGDEQP